MTFKTYFYASTTALVLATGSAQAAKVELDWEDPGAFSDLRAGTNQNQLRFQENVVEELGEHIRQTAALQLPTEQTLKLTIEDVDLAGDVEYFFSNFDDGGVRVIRDVYFPSIEFSYELLGENGDVLESGQENIQDIGFRYAGSDRLANAPLDYEKELIEAWFEETF